MLRTVTSTLVATAAVMLFAGSAMAQQVQITGIAANGSGCPTGSVTGLISGSNAVFLFNSYSVTATRQQPFQTRSCSVAVGMSVPAGVAVTLTEFTWMGTMNLAQGSQGNFVRTLFFAGQPAARNLQERYFGGFNQINITDRASGITATFCNQAETIARANTSLSVGGSNGGTGSIDSVDAAVFQRMALSLNLFAADCGGTIGNDTLNPTPFPGAGGTPAPPRRGRRGGRGGFGGFGGFGF